ncbi:MAG: prolyl oligopeptidase family serine peptidase [Candidatus Aminicenantaceae bacterium]
MRIRNHNKHAWLAFLAIIFILVAGGFLPPDLAAQEGGKKVLTLEDYPQWSRITAPAIAPNGKWATYGYQPNDGDNTLYIKSLTTDTVYEIAGGARPVFSDDSSWAAYRIEPLKEEKEKLQKDKKPVVFKAELLNLATGDKYTVEAADSFEFSKESHFLAIKKRKSDPKAKHGGSDLILRSLKDGPTLNLGNVSQFAFNKPGTHLAYIVDADSQAGNGVYLLTLSTGSMRPLDTGEHDYSQLTWDEEGTAVAALKGTEDKDMLQKSNVLLAFTGIDQNRVAAVSYDPKNDLAFPESMVISQFGTLSWNTDASKVFLGIKEQQTKVESGKDKVADVDVWHWKDEEIQSVQMRRASRDREYTYRSVYHLRDKLFVRLADANMRTVTTTKDGRWGLGRDDTPYVLQLEISRGKADYVRIDTLTKEKQEIEKRLERPLGSSPDGQYFLYLKDKELYVFDMVTAGTTHLKAEEPGFFVNQDDDHQYDTKPGYRPAGWTKDGKSVIMTHKYDLYQVALDGSGVKNLTKGIGTKEEIRFGYIRLDPEEETIDTSGTLLLSAYSEWTKQSGFYDLSAGGRLRRLVFEDCRFGRPQKAKDAEVLIHSRETFVDFPDYYAVDPEFRSPSKITDANPQQAEYAWGRRILIDYESTRGTRLQATLTLPAEYEQGKKYPMLVYHYEKMSQRHHEYSMPVYDDRPHMSTYASDGYLVLMPDIVYADGTPGSNALECVIPAVEKAIELGYADPERIGLQGHSWGGYQSSFMMTQTDIFTCVVTGAPLTNLISMYNILYKSSGNTNQPQIQFGQGRMGKTPWEDMDHYLSQSPVHQAEGIKVPFLILHGTEDGSVDWNQGLEYYTAARRLGKEVILLSYPGEGHHLGKIENQKDFQLRMKQYFDHYLKGAEAADWMTNGIPFLEKKK